MGAKPLRMVFLVALVGSALVMGSTQPATGAASALYTFETDCEGWKVVSNSPQPTPTSAWHHGSPGAPASPAGAMYNGPPYAGGDSEELLTSPAHRLRRRTKITLQYDVIYDYEPEETRAVEEGIHSQWSRNGRTWKELDFHGVTSQGWEHKSYKFRAPRGKLFIRFQVLSDALVEKAGGAVDNVSISGVKKPKSATGCN